MIDITMKTIIFVTFYILFISIKSNATPGRASVFPRLILVLKKHLHILDIFDNISKFYSTFRAIHFEKSSQMSKKYEKNKTVSMSIV